MEYYTPEKLSAHRELTPEGYLLCRNVVVGRTGIQLYTADETNLTPGPDGIVRVMRPPEEVFHPDSIASLNGKPVTLRHPRSAEVTPETWSILAKGTVQDARREGDLLVADLLITDANTITILDGEEVEVSCGYTNEYTQTEPGYAVQSDIRYNHLAVLPDEAGRCGSQCRILDSASRVLRGEETPRMKKSLKDRILAAFSRTLDSAMKDEDMPEVEQPVESMDAEPAEEPKAEEKKEETQDEGEPTIADLCKRIDALEAALADLTSDKKTSDEESVEGEKKEEADEKTQDEAAAEEEEEEGEGEKKDEQKTGDSAAFVQDVLSRSEILAPGIQYPTLDSKDAKATNDSLCALKRKALETALNGKFGDAIRPLINDSTKIATMDCATLHATFVGASEIVKRENNNSIQTADSSLTSDNRSLQQRINDFWAGNQAH